MVQFLQRSSIVEAEKNAREVMQVQQYSPYQRSAVPDRVAGSLVPWRTRRVSTDNEKMGVSNECVLDKESRDSFHKQVGRYIPVGVMAPLFQSR